MASAHEKEISGGHDFSNETQGRQPEHDLGKTQSLDKDIDTQDAFDTQLSSVSTPSDKVPNESSPQENAPPEAQKLEHQKSKGMIALIMSALCVRRLQPRKVLLQMLI